MFNSLSQLSPTCSSKKSFNYCSFFLGFEQSIDALVATDNEVNVDLTVLDNRLSELNTAVTELDNRVEQLEVPGDNY